MLKSLLCVIPWGLGFNEWRNGACTSFHIIGDVKEKKRPPTSSRRSRACPGCISILLQLPRASAVALLQTRGRATTQGAQ